MKKTFILIMTCLIATASFAGNLLTEGFEYANHDMQVPVGWTSSDESWVCGYLEKDHNRIPHTGNWYAFSNAEESWLYMPMYLIESMRYRFSLWAITDGEFLFEIWAGSTPTSGGMHTMFYSTTINKDEYEKVSAYVETIPADCQYFGFRAVALDGATHLTIDDVEIDMVEQYTFVAEEITGDTSMYPGTQAVFHYLVHNTGYDSVDVTMHPSNEFFTDFTCTCNGATGMTIPTEPDEIVEVTMTATLRPEIEPGSVAWLDIQMTIPCNCNTAMVTFWVTPLDPEGIPESNDMRISVFPNPATDFITIEADNLKRVELLDASGRRIGSAEAEGDAVRLDVRDLKAGVYYVQAQTATDSTLIKPLIKR